MTTLLLMRAKVLVGDTEMLAEIEKDAVVLGDTEGDVEGDGDAETLAASILRTAREKRESGPPARR